jgi:polyisoprenoid-binding protein YceI
MSIAESTTTTSTWNIDPAHTTVEFSVKHLMISTVRGHFGAVNGTIVLDEQNPLASSVTAEIDVTSIDTRQEQRDAHLRSPDFFDVEKFPSIKFTSTRIERDGNHFDVYGQLTIRDVTREVVLHTTDEGRGGDPWGGQRAAFSAETKVDRRDFGLTWNQALETGGVLVGNDIKISLEVQAVKAA